MSRHQPSAVQQGSCPALAQSFWLQWVEKAFPNLDSQAYFIPPVYVNRVPMARWSTAGRDVLVLQPAPGQAGQTMQASSPSPSAAKVSLPQDARISDSDVRDDAAMQRVFCCLQKMAEQKGEVLVGLSQLQFGQYLSESCYAAAAAQLPLPASLPPSLPRKWKRGDFDVLLIHQTYGFVVCEVKAFGDNVAKLNMTNTDIENNIRKKLTQAVSQLDKSEVMLSHLVSDITSGLRITKTIAVPNVTASQVQQAISGDVRLTQDLCRCLGATDFADIGGLCLCSDQLSDPKTPWDVNSDVLRELGVWWQRRVACNGPDSQMAAVYKTLVARFCGPATTVTVPCTSAPRLCIKTLSQAVSHTGMCYTAFISLFPEQVYLLNSALPRVFVVGPPGTGKTVMLLLMGTEWLRCGRHVLVVSTWSGSRVACTMLYLMFLQTITSQQAAGGTPGKVTLLKCDLERRYRRDESAKVVEKSLNDVEAAMEGPLYVIADEASESHEFLSLCDKLLKRHPRLHLWAANFSFNDVPVGWQEELLTRPLRSPPVVVREVEKDKQLAVFRRVQPYSERGVPDHTDGPPVTRLYHEVKSNHSVSARIIDCWTCGDMVASFLHNLHVGAQETPTTSTTAISSSGSTTPVCLEWRDVLVVYQDATNFAAVKAMTEAGVPARIMADDDIEDVASATSDVVWVAKVKEVRGIERKIVVWTAYGEDDDRLCSMSRCTSQLVIIQESS